MHYKNEFAMAQLLKNKHNMDDEEDEEDESWEDQVLTIVKLKLVYTEFKNWF